MTTPQKLLEHLFRLSADADLTIKLVPSKGCLCGSCTEHIITAKGSVYVNGKMKDAEVTLVDYAYDTTNQEEEINRVISALEELDNDKIDKLLEDKANEP